MQKVTTIYALKKNGETVKRGTLKGVWNFVIDNMPQMTAEQFKAQGYKIAPADAA